MTDSFDEVAALWRADAPPAESLIRAVRHGRWKLWAGLVVGTLAAMFTTTLGVFFLWLEPGASSVLFAAIQICLPTAIVIRWALSARATWRTAGTSTVDYLRLELERRRHEMRMNRFSRWIMPAFVPALLGWQILEAHTHADAYRANPGMALVGFGGAWVILGAVVVVGIVLQGRKVRRQLEAAEVALRAVESGEA